MKTTVGRHRLIESRLSYTAAVREIVHAATLTVVTFVLATVLTTALVNVRWSHSFYAAELLPRITVYAGVLLLLGILAGGLHRDPS